MRNTVILATRSTGTSPPVMAGITPWSMQPCAVPVPVALTALVAILGMIPLAGSIFWGPMAIAIMGGLLVATVLTLVVVPALYALWFRVRWHLDLAVIGAADSWSSATPLRRDLW